jgi:hypothetical protein
MYSLAALRKWLGSRSRYLVDADSFEISGIMAVAAKWPCGCVATGENYAELALEPCGEHQSSQENRSDAFRSLP